MKQGIVERRFLWLLQRNQRAILSFDVDGWACGILLSHALDWTIAGYYDSEMLLIENGTDAADCIFVDVEIFRERIRSIGHHLFVFDYADLPADFAACTKNCLNPNLLRRFDSLHHYACKYPLGTYHLLDVIFRRYGVATIDSTDLKALSLIWFIDGLSNVMFSYAENVNEWVNRMNMNACPWLVEARKRAQPTIQAAVHDFFSEMKKLGNYSTIKRLSNFSEQGFRQLIQLMAAHLHVEANMDAWCLKDYRSYVFDRQFMEIRSAGDFNSFWKQRPFSMSTYFKRKISFTLDPRHFFPA